MVHSPPMNEFQNDEATVLACLGRNAENQKAGGPAQVSQLYLQFATDEGKGWEDGGFGVMQGDL